MRKEHHSMEDLGRPLPEIEFVAFDLETTGLSAAACRIVEFGAVRFRLEEGETGRFEQLVDPGCPIPADAARVHGIRNAMVRGMPGVQEVLPRFLEFLGGPETVLMAHNAAFDLGFLDFALAPLQCPPPPHRVVDTLRLSRKCLPGLFSHRLEAVGRHLRVAEGEEHRALADARLAGAVFQAILGRNPQLQTVDHLFRLSRPLGFNAGPQRASPSAPSCRARP